MIHNITGAVNTDHVFSATECIQWYCEAFARQTCGQFYILMIICIWPSGFRTAPRVALKIPKAWNAKKKPLLSGKASEDVPVCQPVCQPALSSSPLNYKKKSVCFHAHLMMMFMSTRVHASISVSVYVAPLLPTDGNLRHNVGGLSIEAPSPLPIFPSRLALLPPFPLAPLRSPSRKKSFNLTQAGPRTWLRAVEAFVCYYAETNLALHLTQ